MLKWREGGELQKPCDAALRVFFPLARTYPSSRQRARRREEGCRGVVVWWLGFGS